MFWFMAVAAAAFAQATPSLACPRPAAGSVVSNPPELRSEHGLLELTLYFRGDIAHPGEAPYRYCYVTDSGLQSPTLRLHPGDQLIIHFRNQVNLPGAKHSSANQSSSAPAFQQKLDCEDTTMNATATNLHFHGLNIPPVCHQDDVIHTVIQPGQSFDYRVVIPRDEPPGLYWYHPHTHGFTERQVQGGASGALIVEAPGGSQAVPANTPERLLILRDQPLSDVSTSAYVIPAWDITLNYVPILYKQYLTAKIEVAPSRTEFWRVLNAGAGTIFDLQVVSSGKPQTLQLIALDGVAIQPSSRQRLTSSIVLPPASRAEFLVTTPPDGQPAQLITRAWDTGPLGDSDPRRPIANLVGGRSTARSETPPARASGSTDISISDLRDLKPTATRKLYFSELTDDPNDPDALTYFFLTVAGQKPAMYDMHAPPNLVVHQGAVEDWVIENRALEDHVFHTHQLHFQVLEINGQPLDDREIRDNVNIEHWSGSGPYPNVKVRLDFRAPNLVGGAFPYHCHILRHEDMGMMGTILVVPPADPR